MKHLSLCFCVLFLFGLSTTPALAIYPFTGSHAAKVMALYQHYLYVADIGSEPKSRQVFVPNVANNRVTAFQLQE